MSAGESPSLFAPPRLAVLTGAASVTAAVVAYYARDAWPVVASVALLEMLVQLLYWLPCWLLGRCLLRRLTDNPDAALGVVTAATLGFAFVGFATLALGLAACLSTGVAYALLGAAATLGVADLLVSRAKHVHAAFPRRSFLRARSEGSWLWLLPAAGLGMAFVGACLMPGVLWRPDDPHPYDSLIYHLQVPREWFELGRIAPLLHNVYSFFPFNIEVHYLLADHLRGDPWRAMYQTQFLSLSLCVLTALAIWGAVAPQYGRRAAAVGVLAFTTLPWTIMLSCVSYVESGMLLFGALTIIWFLRGLQPEGKPLRNFMLAGAFAGLACGTKLTSVPMLIAGLPIAAFVGLAASKLSVAAKLKALACFVLCGLLLLSPWLIRNAIWARGNPIFPVGARMLGQAHFTDVQVDRFERAHRPAPAHAPLPARLSRVGSEIVLNWRFNYLLFPLAILAAALAWRRSPAARALLLLILLILLFWLTGTHLMGRFFVLAAIPAALLIASLPRPALNLATVLLAISAVLTLAFPSLPGGEPGLGFRLASAAEKGRMGLFGLESYAVIEEPQLRDLLDNAPDVVFVGDAQLFAHQTPMSRLRYCTIFDLQTDNSPGSRNWIDASYGPAPATAPSSAAIVADLAECNRLQATYFDVPKFQMPPGRDFPKLLLRGQGH